MLSNSQGQTPPVLFPNPPPPPPPQPPAPAQPHPPTQPPPQPPQQFPQFHVKSSLQIKKNAIIDDYKVTTQVLGLGINGKVLQILNKRTQEKFALKVGSGAGGGEDGHGRRRGRGGVPGTTPSAPSGQSARSPGAIARTLPEPGDRPSRPRRGCGSRAPEGSQVRGRGRARRGEGQVRADHAAQTEFPVTSGCEWRDPRGLVSTLPFWGLSGIQPSGNGWLRGHFC